MRKTLLGYVIMLDGVFLSASNGMKRLVEGKKPTLFPSVAAAKSAIERDQKVVNTKEVFRIVRMEEVIGS